MRWTVAGDSLTSLARRRALQWVAAAGLRRVALTTARSFAELMRRGRPARALVCKPATPSARYRRRHTATVFGDTRSRRAIGRTPSPAALARITLARSANPWARLGARNHDSNIARSASVTSKPAAIPPV